MAIRFDEKGKRKDCYETQKIVYLTFDDGPSNITGQVLDILKEKNIFARKYFYPLVSENKEFIEDLSSQTPLAKRYSRQVLCLPLYAGLTSEEVNLICDILTK